MSNNREDFITRLEAAHQSALSVLRLAQIEIERMVEKCQDAAIENKALRDAFIEAEKIAMEASVTIPDAAHESEGCRFTGAGDENGGSAGVTCFACRVQDLLAGIRSQALIDAASKKVKTDVALPINNQFTM